jgi:hypothetical protein
MSSYELANSTHPFQTGGFQWIASYKLNPSPGSNNLDYPDLAKNVQGSNPSPTKQPELLWNTFLAKLRHV